VVWFLARSNRIGATRAATFHFLNPFFGVAIAWLLLGETFGRQDILGVAVIALGSLQLQVLAPAPQPETPRPLGLIHHKGSQISAAGAIPPLKNRRAGAIYISNPQRSPFHAHLNEKDRRRP